MFKHGHCIGGKSSVEAIAYYAAKSRCLNPRNKKYPRYGGNRIDNEGNYEHGNVRWATPEEQVASRNSRSARGTANPVVKLNWEKVRQLRALQGQLSTRRAGEAFGVSSTVVARIWKNRAWKEPS